MQLMSEYLEDYVKTFSVRILTAVTVNFYFFSVVLILIALIVFGVKKEDRGWMPRPDQNYLSWGYGLACISAFFSLFSAGLFFKASKDDIKSIQY